jgi:hypothetical protein
VKNLAKKIGVFDSKYYYFLQKGWFSNADFFSENGEKSVKIVIITSTPGTICILGITQVTIRAHTNVLFMYIHAKKRTLCTYFENKVLLGAGRYKQQQSPPQ